MGYINFKSNYDKFPKTKINGFDSEAFASWDKIITELKSKMQDKKVLTVDCYPGVDEKEVLETIKNSINPDVIFNSEDIFYDGDEITRRMQANITDDRVRGVMFYGSIMDIVDAQKLKAAQEKLENSKGTVLIYGFGAALISQGDVLVYADLSRWEIQLRYRKGLPNFKQTNYDEDNLRKYKRAFFVEWRIADKHKASLYEKLDYFLDTNTANEPKMLTSEAFFAGLDKLTTQPMRVVPYFDPGVWGGQWMKEVCDLDPKEENYAWSFDGVPEENSVLLQYGDVVVESPSMNLVKHLPRQFLGQKTFSRFGAEYPIRFDFLDTFEGQNLSLQVHPLTEYIRSEFGMTYTQDESYYILDSQEGAKVYLGIKEGIDEKQMIADLKEAEIGAIKFDADKYINTFEAKKHNHFLIPAGTVHCSSKGCMVLEISATPYIFTFKLWDWDRVGLDGLPRPIHVDHGEKVIQFDRTTKWVEENLVNHFETIEQNDEYTEVKTGLHELEFIETHVFTTVNGFTIKSDGEFSMLNLVDGKEAIVESPTNAFEPYTVHYAETFIIPANAGDFTIRSSSDEEIKVLRANVRY